MTYQQLPENIQRILEEFGIENDSLEIIDSQVIVCCDSRDEAIELMGRLLEINVSALTGLHPEHEGHIVMFPKFILKPEPAVIIEDNDPEVFDCDDLRAKSDHEAWEDSQSEKQ